MRTVVAFSGGKDSTALALELHRRGVSFELLYTATGNELPGVTEHIARVAQIVRAPMIDVKAPTLGQLIDEQGCLPNWRMRWCTRMIKIEPVTRWLRAAGDVTLCVGLRADEESRVGGTYDAEVRYPLREWGWGLCDVLRCCADADLVPPRRTDCAVCFFQTLGEWYELWLRYPGLYQQGEDWEAATGYTFRSPSRDTRPAALVDLRREFEGGWIPKRRARKEMCHVCST